MSVAAPDAAGAVQLRALPFAEELATYLAAQATLLRGPYRRYEQGREARHALAETILPTPNPNDTTSQAERFEHRDLELLPARELWQEIERARLALILLDDGGDSWALERFNACQVEQAKRTAP